MVNNAKNTRNTAPQGKTRQKTEQSITDEEKAIFANAVDKVTPQQTQRLAPDQRQQQRQRRYTNRQQPVINTTTESTIQHPLTDHSHLAPVSSDAIIHFARDGVRPQQLKKLRSGQCQIDTVVDLHGLHTDAARTLISHTLQTAYANGWRCVHVIHGRGASHNQHPVLKNHVNNWLRQHPYVLAFHSCPASLGSNGAVLVLIRRQRH